jgi:hypothetical protein
MKIIILALMLAVPVSVWAECRTIEYAELKDMSDADLTEVYCRDKGTLRAELNAKPSGSMRIINKCLAEVLRVERIYTTKFSKKPECPKK